MKLTVLALVLALTGAAQAQTLTTFAPNNGSGGIFLDLTPVAGALRLDAFSTYFDSAAGTGTSASIEVWTRPGSYAGFTGSSAGWTLSQTVGGTSVNSTTLSSLVLTSPILLPSAATTAVYLQSVTFTHGIRYTGTSVASPTTTYSNADLSLFSDTARTGNVAFAGSQNSPRTFAGTIAYSRVASVPEPAMLATLAIGGLALLRRRRA